MKRNTNIIIFLLFLISLLCLNNINFFKGIIFKYSNYSFSLFNIRFLISFLIFLVLLVLFNFNKIDKKKFTYFASIILGYNILSNLFYNFDCFGFLLLYIFIIFGTYITQLAIKRNFEYSIVTFMSCLLLTLFVFGLLNILLYVKYLIILLIILGIAFFIKKRKQSNIDFYTKGLYIFSILFFVAVVGGIGRYVHIFDEFSHWAFDAKVTIDKAKITLYTGMNYNTYSYPPLLSVWHYFVSIFNKGYSEPNLYIGLSIIIFTYMMPMFMYIDRKKHNIFTIIIYIITVYSFNLLFDGAYSYTILYADLVMGFIGTAAVITHFYCKKENIDDKYIMIPLLSCISLVKSSGFVLVFTILFLFYLLEYLDIKNRKLNIKKFIKNYILSIVTVCIFLLVWIICVKLSSHLVKYNFSLMPDILKTDVVLKTNKEFLLKFFTNIIHSFDSTIIFTFIRLSLFALTVIIFGSIYYLNKKTENKNAGKVCASFICSYVAFFVLTALSVFVMLSVYEAGELNSFGRYINCYHLILINYILFMMSHNSLSNNKELKCFKNVIFVIFLLVPFSKMFFFITDFNDRYNTQLLSETRTNNYYDIISKTPSDSKIYIIDQKDENSMMNLWYARYYCYPRITNANNQAINWKILTKSNKEDLGNWGFTFSGLEKHLKEYNFEYLFINSITDEFFEGMNNEFDVKITDLENYRLFKIINNGDNIILDPIK